MTPDPVKLIAEGYVANLRALVKGMDRKDAMLIHRQLEQVKEDIRRWHKVGDREKSGCTTTT